MSSPATLSAISDIVCQQVNAKSFDKARESVAMLKTIATVSCAASVFFLITLPSLITLGLMLLSMYGGYEIQVVSGNTNKMIEKPSELVGFWNFGNGASEEKVRSEMVKGTYLMSLVLPLTWKS